MGDSWKFRIRATAERFGPEQTAWAEKRALWQCRNLGIPCLNFTHPDARLILSRYLRRTGAPEFGVAEALDNLMVTQGLDQITKLLIGASATALNNTHGICGMGNGTLPAPAVGDTALIADATSGAFYQSFDSTFPQQANGVITGQSTFASANAQYGWNEWCWATSTGTVGASNSTTLHTTSGSGGWAAATSQFLWNHRVPPVSLGTKGAVAWIFLATITLA